MTTNYQKGIEMIWTRRILQGHSTESVALGIEACKVFNDVTGGNLSLWSPLGGMPYNALAWTQTVKISTKQLSVDSSVEQVMHGGI